MSLLLLFHPRVSGGTFASGALSATGSADVQFGAEAISSATASATGSGDAQFSGAATAAVAMDVTGTSTAEWVGASVTVASGDFQASGSGDMQMAGQSIAQAAIVSDGLSEALFIGEGGVEEEEVVPVPTVPDGFGAAMGRNPWREQKGKRKRRLEDEDREIMRAVRELAPQMLSPYRLDDDVGLERLIKDLAPEIIAHFYKRVQ